MITITCRHCGDRAAPERRNLCRGCYRNPAVRALYPRLKTSHRGEGTHNRHRPPAVPTTTAPGSAERLAVMAERVRRGEAVFHPLDATLREAGANPRPLVYRVRGDMP